MTLTDVLKQSGTQERARRTFAVTGVAHVLGSDTVSNTDLATTMGLAPDWFVRHTGIIERRACGPGQDVTTMAVEAVTLALQASGLSPTSIGNDTVLLHVQNGMTALTPPAGVL